MGKEFDRCLVVDDDEDILTAARLLLRNLFDQVITAASPDDALARLAQDPVDVVLLDANFARGGTDASEGMAWFDRMLAFDPELIVVMITAHAA